MDDHAPIHTLLTMLKAIDESNLPDVNQEEEDVYLSTRVKVYTDYTELISKVIEIADKALITDNGHCDWDAIHIVRQHGYIVFAGEQDRWGWLSGCIQTKKGILVYG